MLVVLLVSGCLVLFLLLFGLLYMIVVADLKCFVWFVDVWCDCGSLLLVLICFVCAYFIIDFWFDGW